ncbi:MAG TPA: arginine--tRNA ligase [Steroidobacteraceae bacterium]|nr:arginine--tRNA ligase [Steroidobacteraceae bacterium]
MKAQIQRLLTEALAALGPEFNLPRDTLAEVDRTKDPAHGDFATNLALRLAKPAGCKPRDLAAAIIAKLPPNAIIARSEIAGAGFINFFLARGANSDALAAIVEQGAAYGRGGHATRESVNVEFVSANPTGPLHVGHGRLAAYGASLANLLEAAGNRVHREYYINDAGRQMEILAASVWLRYLEQGGETLTFPSNGYRGDYLKPIAQDLRAKAGGKFQRPAAQVFQGLPPDAPAGNEDEYIDAVIARARELIGEGAWRDIYDHALGQMQDGIRADLAEFGVTFDTWFSERSLAQSGEVDLALDTLRKSGHLYQKDGAWWFRSTAFGDEKDRVVVRENGQKTYFASDIAYAMNKRKRGFELLLYVWGADHHGYITRTRASLEAAGEPADCFEVRLIQFVALYRGGQQVSMGKRSGEFVTLRDLRTEVGNDATRFFYVMRGNDQHLDFDLELAKTRSNDNPVYYIQYAHARVASVLRQLVDRGLVYDAADARTNLALLANDHELALIKSLMRYPEVIGQAAALRAPHMLVHYLRELANDFHTYYNAHTFIVEDAALRNARLLLIQALRQVIANGLGLIGVSAPDSM